MSIDERVREYMREWLGGATIVWNGDRLDPASLSPATNAGRAAYLAAEAAERERLSYCDCCEVFYGIGGVIRTPRRDCPDCHGTGKRRE